MREPSLHDMVVQFLELGATELEFRQNDPLYYNEDEQWIMSYQYNGWLNLASFGKTQREALRRALLACTEWRYRFSPQQLVEQGELPF